VSAFLKSLSADDLATLAAYRPLAHKRVVLTGKLDGGVLRETLTTWLTTWGATVEGEVVPSTDVLLAVDPERMTAKRKAAARFGITVYDEYGFAAWLSAHRDVARAEADRLAAASAPVPPPEWFAGAEPNEEYEDDIVPLADIVPPKR